MGNVLVSSQAGFQMACHLQYVTIHPLHKSVFGGPCYIYNILKCLCPDLLISHGKSPWETHHGKLTMVITNGGRHIRHASGALWSRSLGSRKWHPTPRRFRRDFGKSFGFWICVFLMFLMEFHGILKYDQRGISFGFICLYTFIYLYQCLSCSSFKYDQIRMIIRILKRISTCGRPSHRFPYYHGLPTQETCHGSLDHTGKRYLEVQLMSTTSMFYLY